MPLITITAEANAALRSALLPGHDFHETGTLQSDGSWLTPMDDEVLARLRLYQHPGESYSDTIVRILATREHGAQ